MLIIAAIKHRGGCKNFKRPLRYCVFSPPSQNFNHLEFFFSKLTFKELIKEALGHFWPWLTSYLKKSVVRVIKRKISWKRAHLCSFITQNWSCSFKFRFFKARPDCGLKRVQPGMHTLLTSQGWHWLTYWAASTSPRKRPHYIDCVKLAATNLETVEPF